MKSRQLRLFLVGGVLPVVAFALVEQWYGTMGGLIAGVIFGSGEMIYEYVTTRKVSGITIGANVLVVVLGLVSLWEGTGVWFKMQPAIILAVFAVFLLGSSLLKKPFLVALTRKQNPNLPPEAEALLSGINIRLALVFLALAALSVEAALHWSTGAWATLKAVGVPCLLFAYLGIEVVWIRLTRSRKKT